MTGRIGRCVGLTAFVLMLFSSSSAFSSSIPTLSITPLGPDNTCSAYRYEVQVVGSGMYYSEESQWYTPPTCASGWLVSIYDTLGHPFCIRMKEYTNPPYGGCDNAIVWWYGWSDAPVWSSCYNYSHELPRSNWPDPPCPPVTACYPVLQQAFNDINTIHGPGAHYIQGREDLAVSFTPQERIAVLSESITVNPPMGGSGGYRTETRVYEISVEPDTAFTVRADINYSLSDLDGSGGSPGPTRSESATSPAYICAPDPQSFGGTQNAFCPIGSSANAASGNLFDTLPLLQIPGFGPQVDLVLAYNSADNTAGSLGPGWRHSYEMTVTEEAAGYLMLAEADGRRIVFDETSPGIYEPLPRYGRLGTTLQKFTDNTYELTPKEGIRYAFNALGRLASITDRNGNALTLSYTGDDLTALTDAAGRVTALGYSAHKLTTVTDPANRTTTLAYTPGGYLETVTDPAGQVAAFAYTGGRLSAEWDKAGNQTTYAYDNTGRLATATDNTGTPAAVAYWPEQNQAELTGRNGGTTTLTYDPTLDLPLRRVAADNGVTDYGYDNTGNLLWTVGPAGDNTSYTYDGAGNRTSVTDPLGHTTTYTHNGFGQVTSVTDPEGHTTTYDYDAAGNLRFVTDATGAVTEYQYDPQGRLTAAILPGKGPTIFRYEDAHGNLTSVTDPAGLATTLAYDPVGNLLTRTDAAGATTTYAYDNVSRLISVTDPTGGVTTFIDDGNGNRTSVTDANGHTTTFTYSERNKPLTMTDPLGGVTRYSYTFGGCGSCGSGVGDLLESVTDAGGHVTSFAYDLMGRQTAVTDPLGKTTSMAYNVAGELYAKTDPNGRETSYTYDPLSRLLTQTDPLGGQTVLAYTPAGHLDTVTDPGGTTTAYAYDNTGRLLQTLSPDTGTTTQTYHPDGTLASKTDATGTTVTFAYDNAARLTQVAFPDPAQNILYGYDDPSVSFGRGRLTSVTDPSGATTLHYDALGRLVREERTILGILYTTLYAWDNVGNLAVVTAPGGRRIEYGYDELNRPVSATAIMGITQTPLASGVAYDNVGNLLALPLGNGLTATRTYDGADRVGSIGVPGVLGLALGYDNVGNLISWTDNTGFVPAPGPGTTTYDYQGNRLDNVVENGFGRTYVYDPSGHTTADGIREFVYNQNRRLIRLLENGLLKGEYTYDGFGRRIIKVAGGATTVYHYDLFGRIIEETDEAGALQIDYAYLGEKPLAMVRPSGGTDNTFFYHTDHLGTPVALTDASGTLAWRVAFDPFGTEIAPLIQTVENNLRFPGQYYDSETGLHYNYFRDYDPRTGRYIEPDPIGLSGSLNAYLYAANNPLIYIDPRGLKEINGMLCSEISRIMLPSYSSGTPFTSRNPVIICTDIVLDDTISCVCIGRAGYEIVDYYSSNNSVSFEVKYKCLKNSCDGQKWIYVTRIETEAIVYSKPRSSPPRYEIDPNGTKVIRPGTISSSLGACSRCPLGVGKPM